MAHFVVLGLALISVAANIILARVIYLQNKSLRQKVQEIELLWSIKEERDNLVNPKGTI
jgi:hypothetical protein